MGEMNYWLSHRSLEDEIKEVIKSLVLDKSSSSDGFTSCFFQRHWEIMKGETVGMVDDFFDGRGSLKHANAMFILLIPKFKGASRVEDFWLISCINTMYKIITKLLANKLSHVVSELLSLNQSTFTKGRIISDNIMLVEELLRGFQ